MMRRLPYGRQLLIALTGILAVALIVFTAIVVTGVAVYQRTQLTARLQTTGTAVASVPDIRNGRIVFDPDDHDQFLSLLDDNGVGGATVSRTGTILLTNRTRDAAGVVAALAHGRDRRGTIRAGGKTLDYLTFPLRSANVTYGYVAVWTSPAPDEGLVRTVLIALLAAALLTTAVAAIAGGAIVRAMLRPVSDLSALMSAIEATDLSARLAWGGPDDELGRLCTTFDRLLDRLEDAFERERRFTADASHELRTPLAVMRAELELALNREREPADYRDVLRRLQRETARLVDIAESLLWTRRRDAGAAPFAPSDVRSIVARAIDRVRASDDPIAFVIGNDAAAYVAGDAEMLERAILAILENARRFSQPGQTVRIDVTTRDEHVEIAISDSGPGFTPAALQHATQRFWRDAGARSGTGSGLGLAIAAAIVERHDGTLSLSNGVLGGAIVTIRLPYNDQQNERKMNARDDEVGLTRS